MRRVHSKDTAPELIVRRLVHREGFRYRLHASNLPGRPDLVFAGRRKVIFVHGCFWHQHSCYAASLPQTNRTYWKAKQERNRTRDKRNIRALRREGWGVLVLWECQIRNGAKVLDKVCRFLQVA